MGLYLDSPSYSTDQLISNLNNDYLWQLATKLDPSDLDYERLRRDTVSKSPQRKLSALPQALEESLFEHSHPVAAQKEFNFSCFSFSVTGLQFFSLSLLSGPEGMEDQGDRRATGSLHSNPDSATFQRCDRTQTA